MIRDVVPVARPRSATYLGPGAVEDLGERIGDDEIGLVCMDMALSPVQQRNLDRKSVV